MRRTSIALFVVMLALLAAAAPAHAVVPLTGSYNARITGVVSEWNSFIPGYQVTGTVDLSALVFVEQRRSAPRPDAPVLGIFTGRTPALDTRPGAILFATNSQGLHVDPNVLGPTQAAIDVAQVQANVAAGTLTATVDEGPAHTITVNLFRTSPNFFSAPAQILAGTIALQFSADARTFTGRLDLGGNGLIEPGNPLFRVRRYTANVAGTATAVTLGGGDDRQGDMGDGGSGGGSRRVAVLRRLRAPRGGLRALRRRGAQVVLTCAGGCRARAVLVVSRAVARRARLRRRIVASGRGSRTNGGRLVLRPRLSRIARLRLAGLGGVRLGAHVVVTGGDGKKVSFRRTLRIGA